MSVVIDSDILVDAIDDAGYDVDGVLSSSYSGRGIFAPCFGIVGDPAVAAKFLISVGQYDLELAYSLADCMRVDIMHIRESVSYFLGYTTEVENDVTW